MTKLDYRDSFTLDEFVGYLEWNKETTILCPFKELYHDCHEDELLDILQANRLLLRSTWDITLPDYKVMTGECYWMSFNDYRSSYYGPYQIKIPTSPLEGLTFIVFSRGKGAMGSRKRLFFVQNDIKLPIYGIEPAKWKIIDQSTIFEDPGAGKGYEGIWEAVLTREISIADSEISPVRHDKKCISKKCSADQSYSEIRKTLLRLVQDRVKTDQMVQDILDVYSRRFPTIREFPTELEFPELRKKVDLQ